MRCEIHKLINFISKEEELPGECKKPIILAISKRGDKTDCSNYSGV